MAWYDTFFDEFYNKTYTHLDWERTEKDVDFIENMLNLKGEHEILDVPCGFGRHAIELTRRGYNVTGLEYSQAQIDLANRLMLERGHSFTLIQGDMREIPFINKFDRAFNFFTSFGYFDADENEKTVEQFYKCLKPGGSFLLEIVSRDWLIRNFIRHEITRQEDGTILLQERHFDPLTDREHGVHTFVDAAKGVKVARKLDHQLYSAFELKRLFEKKGFDKVEIYDGIGGEFRLDSRRITLIARKGK